MTLGDTCHRSTCPWKICAVRLHWRSPGYAARVCRESSQKVLVLSCLSHCGKAGLLGKISAAECHQVHRSSPNRACIWLVQIIPLVTVFLRYLCTAASPVNETCLLTALCKATTSLSITGPLTCSSYLRCAPLSSSCVPLATALRAKARGWINILQLFSFSLTHILVHAFWPHATCPHGDQRSLKRLDDPFSVIFRVLKPRSMQHDQQTQSLKCCPVLFLLCQVREIYVLGCSSHILSSEQRSPCWASSAGS